MSEGGLIPPVILELRAKAGEVFTELGKVRSEVAHTASETETAGGKMSKGFQTAAGAGKAITVGLAGAAVAVGGFAIEAASSAQVVEAKLSTAVKNAGGNFEDLKPKIDDTDAKLRTFGFTNDQTNTALASLTTALKDPQKAMGAMSVAADLARAKNIDLNSAAMLVAKGMEGQTRPLKQLGIDLPTYTGGAQNAALAQQALSNAQDKVNQILAKTPDAANKSSKAHQQYENATRAVQQAQEKLHSTQNAGNAILQAVESRVKGTAAAYGDTLKGKVAAAKAGLESMAESLGNKLIPIITVVITKASQFASWLGKHPALLYTLAGIIGGVVVAAVTAYAISMASAAVATIAATWPILAIIAAVAAVGVGIYELVTHWTTVWNAIKAVIAAVWDWLKGAWDWIKSVFFDGLHAALSFLQGVWSAVWGGITGAFSAVWDFLKSAWSWIKTIFLDVFMAYLHVLEAVWGAVWDGIKAVLSGVWDFIKGVWTWLRDTFIHPLQSAVSTLGDVWGQIWGGIKSVIKDVGGAIAGVLGGIVSGIQTMIGWISKAIGWFTSLFDSANQANTAANKAYDSANKAAAAARINTNTGTILGNLSQAHFPSKDVGGWIYEVARGKPLAMTGHGGEYVLSLDMLAGRQQIDPRVAAAIAGSQAASMSQQAVTGASPSGVTAPGSVTVIAQTNASPVAIASQVGWVMRAMA